MDVILGEGGERIVCLFEKTEGVTFLGANSLSLASFLSSVHKESDAT